MMYMSDNIILMNEYVVSNIRIIKIVTKFKVIF